MADMNTKILEAIRAETEETLREYEDEKNIFGLIVESFKGTFKWTVIFAMLLMIVFAGAAVYCAINLFGEPDVAVKLNWLALGLAAFIVFVALRLWFLMELNRISLKREIKRVELQVVLLANVLQREDTAGTA